MRVDYSIWVSNKGKAKYNEFSHNILYNPSHFSEYLMVWSCL